MNKKDLLLMGRDTVPTPQEISGKTKLKINFGKCERQRNSWKM